MRYVSERKALEQLAVLKSKFRNIIKDKYEFRAKDCKNCSAECCLDANFVNVHITKLEAILIVKYLEKKLDKEKLEQLKKHVEQTVIRYRLDSDAETSSKTFACPFFEKTVGCLIHEIKPLACIQHACYEKREHLPPEDLQAEFERGIEHLNEKTYGKPATWLPLPTWIKTIMQKNNV